MPDDAMPENPGESVDLERDGHRMRVTATRLDGIHTGRRRYEVACLTCAETLHEATTGPMQNIERHLREAPPAQRRGGAALAAAEGGASAPLVDLADIKRLLAEITPGPWSVRRKGAVWPADHRRFITGASGDGGPWVAAEALGLECDANAAGIVALVNAAPLLLEIVEAALDWQALPQGPARLARERILAALARVTR